MTVPAETEKKNPNEEKDLNAFICSQNGILKGMLHSLFCLSITTPSPYLKKSPLSSPCRGL